MYIDQTINFPKYVPIRRQVDATGLYEDIGDVEINDSAKWLYFIRKESTLKTVYNGGLGVDPQGELINLRRNTGEPIGYLLEGGSSPTNTPDLAISGEILYTFITTSKKQW